MVSTSKILTVSYGTFSCTLEGFDDSFETMKAIAEYFRDLAADDRYFGAEPPSPDAEMLARIAQREITRRVDAREEDGKIHLRAQDAEALATTGLLSGETAGDDAEDQRTADPQTTDEAEAAPVAEEIQDTEPKASEPPEKPEAAQEATPEDIANAVSAAAEEVEPDAQPESDDAEAVPEPVTQEIEAEPVEMAEIKAEPDEAASAAEGDGFEEPEDEEVEVAVEEAALDVPFSEAGAKDSEDNAPADEEPALEAYDLDPDIAAFMADAAAEEAELAAAQTDESVDDNVEVDQIEAEIAEIEETVGDDTEESAKESAETPSESSKAFSSVTTDIAQKLERIRSVAMKSQNDYSPQVFSEDEHADDVAETPASDLELLLASKGDQTPETATSPQLERAIETLEQAFMDDEESAEAASDEAASEAFDDVTSSNPEEDDELAQLLDDATPENFFAASEDEDAPDAVLELTEFDPETDTLEPEPLVLGTAERVEIVEEDLPEEAANDEEIETSLSEEDEADLMRELAEVEAEMSVDPALTRAHAVEKDLEVVSTPQASDVDLTEAEAIAEATLQEADQRDALSNTDAMTTAAELDPKPRKKPEPRFVETQTPSRGMSRFLDLDESEPEQDVERIFDKADLQMEDKDATMRRNAIQHLRAAVAATRAEHKAGGKIAKDVDDTLYRSDLAEVVRPHRSGETRTEGATDTVAHADQNEAAPLKLVAEQRVDSSHHQASSFTAFIDNVGAKNLSDILEAAAAYMSDVEGRAEFSRPMLMNKLKEVTQDGYSREDGLRSFGELLRNGKIRKVRSGSFAVTDDTEFRQDARSAS